MRDFGAQRKQKIDLATWERRALFEFFHGFSEPYHGVCIRMDCTETYNFARERGLSVFVSLLHRSLMAAHEVDNFRTRVVQGEVWRYEQINGGAAIGRPNGTIAFAHFPYCEDLPEFACSASAEIDRVRQRDDLERYPEANLIRYSSLPWLDFTSISHARDFSKEDSAPRVTFGRITSAEGRRTLPVAVHAHHGLVDGSHVSQFIEQFQRYLDDPTSCRI